MGAKHPIRALRMALRQGSIHEQPMFVQALLANTICIPTAPALTLVAPNVEEAGLSGMAMQADGTPDTGTVDMGFHYPLP